MNTLKKLIVRILTVKQRKDKRFMVHDRVFVVFGPLLIKRKQIIDISMSGLSYLDIENQPTRSIGLNILAENSLYFDDRISFIPISKSEVVHHPDNSTKIYRHAVQFMGLTRNQKSQLKNFIHPRTLGRA